MVDFTPLWNFTKVVVNESPKRFAKKVGVTVFLQRVGVLPPAPVKMAFVHSVPRLFGL